MPLAYIYLVTAIVFETIGTTALKASAQFTKPLPTVITLVCFLAAIYLLGLSFKSIPVGIAYAIWSGLGIVLIATFAYLVYGQKLDLPALIGIAMILGGILVINLFSKTTPH
ncbi:DMT family transporter [Pseudaestuariivita sp.]|uniref:DMT family transporter n=1 Tax=Pseudaestuariivita sp. TaxID=2211669 RepID=UPI004058E562